MTGTTDAQPFADGAKQQRGLSGFTTAATPPSALIEQTKGVLIFRYAISAEAAYSLMELWAAEADTTVEELAHAVVHEICQGDRSAPSDATLVRWLEERLRHEFPGVTTAPAAQEVTAEPSPEQLDRND